MDEAAQCSGVAEIASQLDGKEAIVLCHHRVLRFLGRQKRGGGVGRTGVIYDDGGETRAGRQIAGGGEMGGLR